MIEPVAFIWGFFSGYLIGLGFGLWVHYLHIKRLKGGD